MDRQIEPKEGVYISQSGKLKTFHVDKEKYKWIVEDGTIKNHPLLRIKIQLVHTMSVGYPVFDFTSPLYKCEWISEL